MKLLIDTEWFEAIKDLSDEKQQEIIVAILNYPNGHSDTHIWNKVILPALEKGRIGYFNKINHLKQYKHTVSKSDTVSDTDNRTERKEKKEEYISNNSKNNNNINIKNNNSYILQNTRVNPTQEQVLEYAAQQNNMAGVGGFACTPEQAQDFYDYYTGIGWVLPNDAKTPIVDWKPFLRKWVRNPRFKNNDNDVPDINDLNNFKI